MPGKYLTAREDVNVNKFSFDEDHRYSTQVYIQLYCTIVETNYY